MMRLAKFGSFFAVCFFAFPLWAGLPAAWEADFAKASLAYQSGKYSETLLLLMKIEKGYPNSADVVELKALTLKGMGDRQAARREYLRLYDNASQERAAKKKPIYSFELGTLALGDKKYQEADKYLRESIKGGFNVTPSHFLLGKVYYEQGMWEIAEKQFERVLTGENEILKPTAQLFLAQTAAKLNHTSDAVNRFVSARELASEVLESKYQSKESQELARRVLLTADRELRSFDKSLFQMNIGLASGYDSNVLSVPNTDASASAKPGSFKETLNWGAVYTSSPIHTVQWVAGYSGSVNYNVSADTKSGQFLTQDLSNYLTLGALKSTQYGMKIGGNGVFQYQTDAFKPYGLTGSFGPYVRTRLNDSWTFGAETFFQPTKNYLDGAATSPQRKSGWEESLRVYMASSQPSAYWTPGVYLSGSYMRPNGEDYQGTRAALDFSNNMYLSENWIASQTAGVASAWYPYRSTGNRTDQSVSIGTSAAYLATSSLTLSTAASFLKNMSNDDTYRYTRLNISLSADYRF